MEIRKQIPFELDQAALLARAHIEPDSDDAKSFSQLVNVALEKGRPKALYAEMFVDSRNGDDVVINGITFTSRMLRANLDKVDRVFPYVATCGHEMDEVPLPPGEFLAGFWWDVIKASLLGSAIEFLNAELELRYLLGKTSSMNPGAGDADVWPIEQQGVLFALLGGVTPAIDVRLTDSFLMVPNKSVSGIRFPTEKDFRACQVCRREKCEGRSAPFDKAMWESIHGRPAE